MAANEHGECVERSPRENSDPAPIWNETETSEIFVSTQWGTVASAATKCCSTLINRHASLRFPWKFTISIVDGGDNKVDTWVKVKVRKPFLRLGLIEICELLGLGFMAR